MEKAIHCVWFNLCYGRLRGMAGVGGGWGVEREKGLRITVPGVLVLYLDCTQVISLTA